MKIKYTNGCTINSLLVDNKDYDDINNSVKLKLCEQIKQWLINNPSELQDILIHLAMNYGELDGSEEPCECCGDFIDEYMLDL